MRLGICNMCRDKAWLDWGLCQKCQDHCAEVSRKLHEEQEAKRAKWREQYRRRKERKAAQGK